MPEATPPHYGNRRVYGPFHRLFSPTQDPKAMRAIIDAGELWGRPRRNSDIPEAKAYFGELPDGKPGFEFWAFTRPRNRWGRIAGWVRREDGHVWGTGDWAKIAVAITKVRQDY